MNFLLKFDGVVVADNYPNIGKPNPGAIGVLKRIQKDHDIILNSFRTESNNGTLDEAIEYLTKHNIFLHTVLPQRMMPYEWQPDYFIKTGSFYIDDMSYGVPLIKCENGNRRWMVDWTKIERVLEIKNLI